MFPKVLKAMLIPLLLTAGCATQRTGQVAGYSFLNQPQPPVCERTLAPANAGEIVENRLLIPVPGGPPQEDLQVGEKIRAMLMEDKTLAPAPSNVITVVSKGVVTMKGYVRSRRAAFELHQRIASLPGVVSVQDELTLWNGHKI